LRSSLRIFGSYWLVGSGSDSVLLGELLNGVTTLGGTAKLRNDNGNMASVSADTLPQPEHLKQSLVWSPGQADDSEVARRAKSVYDGFSDSKGDKALVGIGSTKSNPVVEIVLARAFNCDPFVSEDDIESSSSRSVPFFMRYRDNDPHPGSCIAGMNLSKQDKNLKAGIYYEDATGKWVRCGSDKAREEVAFVFYVHRESQGRLEMVMGGFYSAQGLQIGAFIVQFTMPAGKKEVDILRTDLVATADVTPIPAEAIARRLEKRMG